VGEGRGRTIHDFFDTSSKIVMARLRGHDERGGSPPQPFVGRGGNPIAAATGPPAASRHRSGHSVP